VVVEVDGWCLDGWYVRMGWLVNVMNGLNLIEWV
jgi:hypothetical protein